MEIICDKEKVRIDKYLSEIDELSLTRAKIQKLIKLIYEKTFDFGSTRADKRRLLCTKEPGYQESQKLHDV